MDGKFFVLILVLMEYENTGIDGEPTFTASVLILVLMEYENT